MTEDLIADEDVVLTISHNNYIKRMKLDTYNKQNRGGQGILGMSTKEGDFGENILITTTHHTILFFTSRGRVHYLKAYQIAEASRQARGTALINLLKLDKGEKITAVLQVREYNPAKFLFMATRKGIVKNITDYGAFIDLDGLDGLLHITDMSWGRISHPSEMLKVGEEISVMILDVDSEKERVSLGLKQTTSNPWENIERRYPEGARVRGKVVNLVNYGATASTSSPTLRTSLGFVMRFVHENSVM